MPRWYRHKTVSKEDETQIQAYIQAYCVAIRVARQSYLSILIASMDCCTIECVLDPAREEQVKITQCILELFDWEFCVQSWSSFTLIWNLDRWNLLKWQGWSCCCVMLPGRILTCGFWGSRILYNFSSSICGIPGWLKQSKSKLRVRYRQ